MEGKTKHPHCRERLIHALDQTQRQARPILCAGWAASADQLQLSPRRQRLFLTTLKSTRWGRLSKEEGYVPRDAGEGTPTRLTSGVLVKWKEVPLTVRFFKLVAPDGASDGVLTKDLAEPLTAQVAQASSAVRGQVAALHRGRKQLTGTEKCPCRGARAQRQHLACCYHAGGSLQVTAQELGQPMDA